MSSAIEAALVELAPAERSLMQSYIHAVFLASNNALSDDARNAYMTLRAEVVASEAALRAKLVAAFSPFGLEDQIPALPSWPTLDGVGSEPSVGTAGLGAVPVIWGVLVAAAVVDIVIIGAIAYTVVQAIEIGSQIWRDIVRVRENTKRYGLQIEQVQRRFQLCLQRTGDFEACGEQFRTPQPEMEPPAELRRDPMMIAAAVGAGILALGGVALGWRYLPKGSSAPRRVSRRRGNPKRLSNLLTE